jgi:hypothetical protein
MFIISLESTGGPNEPEPRSDVCSLFHLKPTLAGNFYKYKLTSIAFRKLTQSDAMQHLFLAPPAGAEPRFKFGRGPEIEAVQSFLNN